MSNSQPNFKLQHDFQKRANESARICKKYIDRIPIIVESIDGGIKLDKTKYLTPHDLTVGQFLYVIRKRIKLEPEKALFMFFNNTLQPATSLMNHVYKQHKDKDGFLYATVSLESTFG